jgi:hypothetical protein
MTVLDVLGVKVSKVRTHVSTDTCGLPKRWIHFGEEATGAPLGSLFETVRLVKRSEWIDVVSHVNPSHPFYGATIWFREFEARWLSRTSSLVSRGLLAEFFLLSGRGSLRPPCPESVEVLSTTFVRS